jgi:hypothetical protein
MSPALVAEYQTRLPDKSLLQAKLYEQQSESQTESAMVPQPAARLPAGLAPVNRNLGAHPKRQRRLKRKI